MLELNELIRRFSKLIPGQCYESATGKNLELSIYAEPLGLEGLEEMHRYSKNSLFYEFLEYEPFNDITQTRRYIEKLLNRMSGKGSNKTANYWFIRRKSDNYLIGTAALVDLDFARQSISWGYGVDPELWGEGYILQIQEILKHYVFDVLELNRLWGRTMVTNIRTIASLQAAGMVNEGVFREFYNKRGTFIDSWEYSMLRSQYLNIDTAVGNRVIGNKHATDDFSEKVIVELIAKVITEENVDADSGMHSLMTWDSLNHMNIMVALHEHFDVKLEPTEITRATSVKAIKEILEKRI